MPVLALIINGLGLQLLAGALGLSVTLVLLDSTSGMVRDHPPLAWRVAGALSGPLALLSLAALLLGRAPLWVSLALVLPYTLLALAASWAWCRKTPAEARRGVGRQAVILGLIALLFASLDQSGDCVMPVLSLAASAGTAALVGGLALLLLGASVGRGRNEVEVEANLNGIPSRVVATGLGITLLAISDVGQSLLFGSGGLPSLPLGLWVCGSLLIPLALLLVGRKFRRFRPTIWGAAFAAVMMGQLALQTLISQV